MVDVSPNSSPNPPFCNDENCPQTVRTLMMSLGRICHLPNNQKPVVRAWFSYMLSLYWKCDELQKIPSKELLLMLRILAGVVAPTSENVDISSWWLAEVYALNILGLVSEQKEVHAKEDALRITIECLVLFMRFYKMESVRAMLTKELGVHLRDRTSPMDTKIAAFVAFGEQALQKGRIKGARKLFNMALPSKNLTRTLRKILDKSPEDTYYIFRALEGLVCTYLPLSSPKGTILPFIRRVKKLLNEFSINMTPIAIRLTVLEILCEIDLDCRNIRAAKARLDRYTEKNNLYDNPVLTVIRNTLEALLFASKGDVKGYQGIDYFDSAFASVTLKINLETAVEKIKDPDNRVLALASLAPLLKIANLEDYTLISTYYKLCEDLSEKSIYGGLIINMLLTVAALTLQEIPYSQGKPREISHDCREKMVLVSEILETVLRETFALYSQLYIRGQKNRRAEVEQTIREVLGVYMRIMHSLRKFDQASDLIKALNLQQQVPWVKDFLEKAPRDIKDLAIPLEHMTATIFPLLRR